MAAADRVRGLPLVLRVRVRMQETHRDDIDPVAAERVDLGFQTRKVERHDLCAVDIEPLRDLATERSEERAAPAAPTPSRR